MRTMINRREPTQAVNVVPEGELAVIAKRKVNYVRTSGDSSFSWRGSASRGCHISGIRGAGDTSETMNSMNKMLF